MFRSRPAKAARSTPDVPVASQRYVVKNRKELERKDFALESTGDPFRPLEKKFKRSHIDYVLELEWNITLGNDPDDEDDPPEAIGRIRAKLVQCGRISRDKENLA